MMLESLLLWHQQLLRAQAIEARCTLFSYDFINLASYSILYITFVAQRQADLREYHFWLFLLFLKIEAPFISLLNFY